MRAAILLAVLPFLALSSPTPSDHAVAIARAHRHSAVQPAERQFEAILADARQLTAELDQHLVEARQLAPGGLANIDVRSIVDQVTKTLQGVTGLTGKQLNALVGVIESVLSGKGVSPEAVASLCHIPADILRQLPGLLSPILVPATAGIPGINQIVSLLLTLLGNVGGLTSGVTGEVTRRDGVHDIKIDDILGQLTTGLKGLGLADDVLRSVRMIVGSLLEGDKLDASAISTLLSLPGPALRGIIDAVKQVLGSLPAVGEIVSPLLSALQVLIAVPGGLLGVAAGSADELLNGTLD